jgi:GT2 family glycosyltransferase/peptidoglycan/xylan/chitin deacetylase (PgdA/CDA1 family)
MDLPSFSIVIPTYQRRETVCDAVRTAGAIVYAGSLEILVVVDGSTDGTEDALLTIDCPFPMRVIRQANAGPASARNHGAAEAAGDILLFLDDDMMCDPDIVANHAASYADGADAVRGPIRIEANSPPGFLTDETAKWSAHSLANETHGTPLKPFDFAGGHLSVRRSVFEELGGFDIRFTEDGLFAEEDADFGVRLIAQSKVHYNPKAICYHRYVVTPRLNMQKALWAARAHMLFARKHPKFARTMFELRGRHRWQTRWFYRPLGRIPGMARLLPILAVRLAEAAQDWPRPLNKAVGYFFRLARGTAYWAAIEALGGAPISRKALVLCYHVLRREEIGHAIAPYAITLETLEEQLDSLLRRGYTFISASELLAFVHDGGALPNRAVLVTFDDGYAAMLEIAEKILKPRKIPSLVFAVTGVASHTNEWDQTDGAPKLALLKPDELRHLTTLGCEVGSHSRTHPVMPELDEATLFQEAKGSADDLVDMGLPRPDFFAYPYYYRDARSIAAVAKSGYAAAFGLTDEFVTPQSNIFDLPRVAINPQDRGAIFHLVTRWPRPFCRLARGLHRIKRARATRR